MSFPEVPQKLKSAGAKNRQTAIQTQPQTGLVSRLSGAVSVGRSQAGEAVEWIASRFSFWTFVTCVAVISGIYFFFILEPMYVSESFVTLKNKAPSSGLSGLLGSLTGADTTQDTALINHIQSYDMLLKLDKKLHLRENWSSHQRNFMNRLSADAQSDDFLLYYQGMINIQFLPDSGLIQIDADGFDANSSLILNEAIVQESEQFMNTLSLNVQTATLKFAQTELRSASEAVVTAQQPVDRGYAEARLSAAQSGLAAAAGVASAQQVWVERVSGPNLPAKTTLPYAWLDTFGVTLLAAILYIVTTLLWSNVRDHRRV